jgi:hypothetical protein
VFACPGPGEKRKPLDRREYDAGHSTQLRIAALFASPLRQAEKVLLCPHRRCESESKTGGRKKKEVNYLQALMEITKVVVSGGAWRSSGRAQLSKTRHLPGLGRREFSRTCPVRHDPSREARSREKNQ